MQHICKQKGLGVTEGGEEGTRVTVSLPAVPSVLEIFLLACRSPKSEKHACVILYFITIIDPDLSCTHRHKEINICLRKQSPGEE